MLIACDNKDAISYEQTGVFGDNLLRIDTVVIEANSYNKDFYYSFSAILEENATLRVLAVNPADATGSWGYGSSSGWIIGLYDWENRSREFTAYGPEHTDAHLTFNNTGTLTLEIYENGAETPTRVKVLTW